MGVLLLTDDAPVMRRIRGLMSNETVDGTLFEGQESSVA